MKFSVAIAVFALVPSQGFQLSMSSTGYFDSMARSSSKPANFSPFGKKMADGKGSSAYLENVQGSSAPSYSPPAASSYEPASFAPAAASTSNMGGGSVKPASYSPFGKKMSDGKGSSAYLNAVTGSSPSYTAPAPANSGYQPSAFSPVSSVGGGSAKPASYSPFGKKMADGKGSSAYLNAVTSSSPSYAAPSSGYQSAPAAPGPVSSFGGGSAKPANYSPFGKKMADGKGSSAYLNTVTASSPSYSAPASCGYQSAPAAAGPVSSFGGGSAKPASYSPFGKKMADGKGSSAYLNTVTASSPSYSAPATSGYQAAASSPVSSFNGGSAKPASYSPFGKKMADGKGSSAYLNAVAGSSPSYSAPAATSSYQPAPAAPAPASTSSYLNMGGGGAAKPASYSPFGKKMGDGKSSSAYLDNVSGAAPSFSAPGATSSYQSAPAAPAPASTSSYLNMGGGGAAKPASYSPFGKKMGDGKSSSIYLENMNEASPVSNSYNSFQSSLSEASPPPAPKPQENRFFLQDIASQGTYLDATKSRW